MCDLIDQQKESFSNDPSDKVSCASDAFDN